MKFTKKASDVLKEASNLSTKHFNAEKYTVHLAVALLAEYERPSEQPPHGDSDYSSLFHRVVQRAGGNAELLRDRLMSRLPKLPRRDSPPQTPGTSKHLQRVLTDADKLREIQEDSYVSIDHLVQAVCTDFQVQQALKEANISNIIFISAAVQQISDTSNLEKFTIDMTALARNGKIDPVIGREEEIRRVIQILSRRTKGNPVLIGEPGVGKTTVVEGLARRIVNADVPDTLSHCRLLSLDVGSLVAGSMYRGEFEKRLTGMLKEIEESSQPVVLFVDEIHLLMGAGATGEGGMDAANLLKPMLAREKLRCLGATTLGEYRKYIEKDAAFERRLQKVLVQEPTVSETISILRGLKEKYEVHHGGVRILDAAIVTAATLAERYLTARRLPDSAFDLIDEAAAAARVARESEPEALNNLERKFRHLQIEIHALEQEKDRASKTRLRTAEQEASNIQEELQPMRQIYESEKQRNRRIQDAKTKLGHLKDQQEDADGSGDITAVAVLRYITIPETQQQINMLESQRVHDNERVPLLADEVGPDQVNEIVACWTGIPVTRLKETEKDKLLHMEEHLGKVVVGQREAVASVSNAIRLQRSGLSNPNSPPSFLFCGASGTGKTLLTKALAEFLFDDPRAMIRFDMSEYQERHSLSRMIGAPPGYAGHDAGGQLTESLRRRPFSILLFDEVEKGAKEVLTVLLQLMDDGRITDSQSRVVDARHCIVVMTSNLGAEHLSQPSAEDGEIDPQIRELVMGALRNYFLPEFLNRISSTVIFNRLAKGEIRKLVDFRLDEIQRRLEQSNRHITIQCIEEVKDYLGESGYSPAYGARPLGRIIEREVLNQLAVLILQGSIQDGEPARIVMDNSRIRVLPNHETDADKNENKADEDDLDVINEAEINSDDTDLYD